MTAAQRLANGLGHAGVRLLPSFTNPAVLGFLLVRLSEHKQGTSLPCLFCGCGKPSVRTDLSVHQALWWWMFDRWPTIQTHLPRKRHRSALASADQCLSS